MRRREKSAKISVSEFRDEKSDQDFLPVWLASQYPGEFDNRKRNMSWEEHDEIVTSSALDKTTIKFCTNCGSSKIDKYQSHELNVFT
jgi:hypothetical protein